MTLLLKTLRAGRRLYHRKARAWTTARVRGLFRPNLDAPIFIIGAPRSGTTFLGSCLAVLPEVSYHFEPVATKYAARFIYERTWDYAQGARYYRKVYRTLMRVYADADLRFSEKTPRNAFLIPFLYDTFPTAQFIHIIRDGRDAALSLSKKPWFQAASAETNKREPGGYRWGPYARFWVEPGRVEEFEQTTDLHRCIWAWRRHVASARESLGQVPPAQTCTLRYEEVVQDPTAAAGAMLDFLEIQAPQSREVFEQAVKRARPESVGRWRQELGPDSLTQIEHEAGGLLRAYGYED